MLSWETWRAVLDVLRSKALPCKLELADYIEQQLQQHPPSQPLVRLSRTDGLFLHSLNLTPWQLRNPLPAYG